MRGRGAGEEILPHVATGGGREVFVGYADVDSGLERGVDVVDAVGREGEDSFKVFQDSEEDW